MSQIGSDDLVPLDRQSVEDFCRDPFDIRHHLRIQTAVGDFRKSNRIQSSTDMRRDVRSRGNWGKISADAASINQSIDSSIARLKESLSASDDREHIYETTVRIRNLYFIKSLILFLGPDEFVLSSMAIKEAAFNYALRAVEMSRNEFSLDVAYQLAIRLSRHEEAARLLGDLVALKPADAKWRLELADTLLHMARQEEALEQAKCAFALAPGSESTMQALKTCSANSEVAKHVRVSSARWPHGASEFDDLKALVKRHVIAPPPRASAG